MVDGSAKIRWLPSDGVGARDLYLVPTVLRFGGPAAWYVCDDPATEDSALTTAYGLVWLHTGHRWDRRRQPGGGTYTCWAYRTVADGPAVRRGSQLGTRDGAASALMFHLRDVGRLRPPAERRP